MTPAVLALLAPTLAAPPSSFGVRVLAQAPKDVGAGWTAFLVFLGMALAVVVLGFSLRKHLKVARRNFDGARGPASETGAPGTPGSTDPTGPTGQADGESRPG